MPGFYRARSSMPSVHKSVLLGHSAQTMFDLVADVASYPQFLPWCGGVDILDSSPVGMTARIVIDFGGIRQSFTTANTHVHAESIALQLVDGPFSSLDGHWRFRKLRVDACKVEFKLDYSIGAGLLARALEPVFDHIAGSLVEAFVRRADDLHG